jgi:hypothetical protein
MIILHHYASSTIHELDVAIPRETHVSTCIADEIHVLCDGEPLDEFLGTRFASLSDRTAQKLCCKIARSCAMGKIRSLEHMSNPYDPHLYAARLEVGAKAAWMENRERPY